MENEKKWYVVYIYSGYEKKVKENLEKRITTTGMEDKIFSVMYPEEEEIVIKDGVKKSVIRKVYPGYVLVEMIMDDDSWYVVRNTQGVTGFVGAGNKPVPVEDFEMEKIFKMMGMKKTEISFDGNIGDKVEIIDGALAGFVGTITEIDREKGKLHVVVSMFGRETPLEVEFDQVQQID